MSIRSSLIECFDSFSKVLEEARCAEYEHGEQEQVSLASWTDELGRLRVWSKSFPTTILLTKVISDYYLAFESHFRLLSCFRTEATVSIKTHPYL